MAAHATEAPWVGPKKGSWVKVLRPESYWYQTRGQVVNVNQKPEIKRLSWVDASFEALHERVSMSGRGLSGVCQSYQWGPMLVALKWTSRGTR